VCGGRRPTPSSACSLRSWSTSGFCIQKSACDDRAWSMLISIHFTRDASPALANVAKIACNREDVMTHLAVWRLATSLRHQEVRHALGAHRGVPPAGWAYRLRLPLQQHSNAERVSAIAAGRRCWRERWRTDSWRP
jgi:hypothetical protein